ncbi:hypothetical protein HPB50_018667 [Hyalomma asiaticum]|uniref:Uncharacterized protein n=1 Tax=Hyalomma asiaticum TaxID=266040 RepID=A0ACB7SFZ9_HYAAI|nr:hypothetical protein HPB50_018667 [Hyalomma asiaticum]
MDAVVFEICLAYLLSLNKAARGSDKTEDVSVSGKTTPKEERGLIPYPRGAALGPKWLAGACSDSRKEASIEEIPSRVPHKRETPGVDGRRKRPSLGTYERVTAEWKDHTSADACWVPDGQEK